MEKATEKKIAIFVCHDLTGLLVLNRILYGIKKMGFEPVIFNTGDNRNRKFKVPTPPVVSFFNSKLLRDVIIPVLERQSDLHQKNLSYKQLATIHNVEYREIADINDPAFVAEIASDDTYTGAIAIRFLQLFNSRIIDVFHQKGFFWNLHSGLLPDYKGLLTPFRAMDNGEKTWGMTLHDLTIGIDEGSVIQRCEMPLDPESPVLDLYISTVPLGAGMILENLALYKEDGKIILSPQAPQKTPRYFTNPTAAELREYMAKGIVYADPYFMVERLVKLFAVTGSSLAVELKRALLTAISNKVAPPPVISEKIQNQISV